MKRYSLVLLVALFSPILSAVAALKIGYVNLPQAFEQEQEAQKHTADLEKEERSILENEQKARTEIELEMAKLQENMPKLSDKARQEQQAALGEKINKKQEQLNQKRVDHNQKRQQILADLENKNRLLLESVSRKENLDLVLNSAAVLYMSSEIKKNDITSKLISEYNKAYPVKAEPVKKGPSSKPVPPPAPSSKKPAPAKKSETTPAIKK